MFIVYSVFFLETVQTVLSGADLYYWFAAGFGNLKHLNLPFAAAFDLPIIGSAVSLSVQFFFVYRIFKLSKKRSRWLCVTICLVLCFQCPRTTSFILTVVLRCWCIRGVRGGCHREPPPFTSHRTWLNYSSRISVMTVWKDHYWTLSYW